MSSLSTSFALLPPSQQPAALSEFLASLSRRHLSHVKAQTDQLLRTDIISELPQELAIRVFHYLDASSLCYAAQVSSAWKRVADDDVLWYRMCEQVRRGGREGLTGFYGHINPQPLLLIPLTLTLFRGSSLSSFSLFSILTRNARNAGGGFPC